MNDTMVQEEAMNMSNEQAVQILIPMRNMMCDQYGCPISDAVFALDKAIEALKAEPNTLDRSDLIRRGDVMKAICEVCLDGESLYKGCKHHWNCPYLTKIDKIPTVSAEAVQGEWVEYFDGNEWTWYCTNCKTKYYQEDLYMGGSEFPRFCPNCGTRMENKE